MTSALDSDTEKVIVSTLFDAMKGKSVLVIAHRMSTIRKADVVSNRPLIDRFRFKVDQTLPFRISS
jgi:ABC-type transport system involved in Fe-S cluster assembly fused permease/ATPase subunit